MNRRRLLYILVVVTLLSCDFKPMTVLSEEDMALVLVDVHIAEHTLDEVSRGNSNKDKQAYMNEVFARHGITKEDYDASVDWYARNPEIYMNVYKSVEDSLARMLVMIENYEFHPQEIPTYADSIDTVDIWMNVSRFVYSSPKNKKRRLKDLDTLQRCVDFEYDDTLFFDYSDKYTLSYRMRVYDENDSTVFYNSRLIVERTDSVVDTVATCVLADSVMRVYTYRIAMSDSVKVMNIRGCLLDTINSKSLVEIDSIEFKKVFEYYEYPLPQRVKSVVDSVEMRGGAKVEMNTMRKRGLNPEINRMRLKR